MPAPAVPFLGRGCCADLGCRCCDAGAVASADEVAVSVAVGTEEAKYSWTWERAFWAGITVCPDPAECLFREADAECSVATERLGLATFNARTLSPGEEGDGEFFSARRLHIEELLDHARLDVVGCKRLRAALPASGRPTPI